MMSTQVEPRIWDTEGERKREAVKHMFGEIAPSYDLVNSMMSARLHNRWRSLAVAKLSLREGGTALDVCCGTGDFMVQLRKQIGASGSLLGLDFCKPMLKIGQKKNVGQLGVGDACQLPVRSDTVDAVTVGWGIRNVPDIDKAHAEISRVLKPGGRFVSLDMAVPRNGLVRGVSNFIFHKIVPKLGGLFGAAEAYTYLPKSTERFLDRQQLSESMARAGLTEIHFEDLFFGNICIHYGRKPVTL